MRFSNFWFDRINVVKFLLLLLLTLLIGRFNFLFIFLKWIGIDFLFIFFLQLLQFPLKLMNFLFHGLYVLNMDNRLQIIWIWTYFKLCLRFSFFILLTIIKCNCLFLPFIWFLIFLWWFIFFLQFIFESYWCCASFLLWVSFLYYFSY